MIMSDTRTASFDVTGSVVLTTGDVSDPVDVREVAKAIDTFGHLDVVLSNAGGYEMEPDQRTGPDAWNTMRATAVGSSPSRPSDAAHEIPPEPPRQRHQCKRGRPAPRVF